MEEMNASGAFSSVVISLIWFHATLISNILKWKNGLAKVLNSNAIYIPSD